MILKEMTASQIDRKLQNVMDIARHRSRDVLREKGSQLSFDDLLAAIYFQGWKDSQADNPTTPSTGE